MLSNKNTAEVLSIEKAFEEQEECEYELKRDWDEEAFKKYQQMYLTEKKQIKENQNTDASVNLNFRYNEKNNKQVEKQKAFGALYNFAEQFVEQPTIFRAVFTGRPTCNFAVSPESVAPQRA